MIKRQKYHLEPDRGLLNDPNGLVFTRICIMCSFSGIDLKRIILTRNGDILHRRIYFIGIGKEVLFCRTSFMSKMEFTQGVH